MKRMPLLICIICISIGAAAFAENASAALSISSRLLSTVIVSTTSLDFGSWEQDDTVNVATATVTVQASPGTAYAITLDAGLNANGAFWRYVKNGADTVPYLIVDPTGSFLWGDGGYENDYPLGGAVQGLGNGLPQSFTADGFLFAQFADPAAGIGLYADTVTVTVYY